MVDVMQPDEADAIQDYFPRLASWHQRLAQKQIICMHLGPEMLDDLGERFVVCHGSALIAVGTFRISRAGYLRWEENISTTL